MTATLRRHPSREDKVCFLRSQRIGTFALRPLVMPGDAALVHDWVGKDYARYWNMAEKSRDDVARFYDALVHCGHAMAYLGLFDGKPSFLVERFDPARDPIADYYKVMPGDRGMHILVAPLASPIPGFTLAIMRTVMDYLFAYPSVRRVVIEPDIRNHEIHALTRSVGFRYDRPVVLREKTAHLAFCTREDYARALAGGKLQASSPA